jgi:hypothetical protein
MASMVGNQTQYARSNHYELGQAIAAATENARPSFTCATAMATISMPSATIHSHYCKMTTRIMYQLPYTVDLHRALQLGVQPVKSR